MSNALSVRRNVKKSPDLGKSIPWPTTVRSITWLSEMLRKAFLRWRAFTILSQVSELFSSMYRLKLSFSPSLVVPSRRMARDVPKDHHDGDTQRKEERLGTVEVSLMLMKP